MRHWQARRLLSSLPDGLLTEAEELRVRAHLESCARCRSELGALEASEALLRRVPATLLPLAPTREASGRLALLARWAGSGGKPSRASWIEAWGIPTVGALVGVAALSLSLFAGTAPPEIPETSEAFNYVLAGELSSRPPVHRTSPSRPPSFQVVSTTLPELAFLPPGVR
ncbi:MAG TPA: zf-HC2 domain-containing protein [Myxococcota bacterium]|nr:zf-HC2 domain-containing protein [Myxococcota bacterium]